jgi:hypothetical protein
MTLGGWGGRGGEGPGWSNVTFFSHFLPGVGFAPESCLTPLSSPRHANDGMNDFTAHCCMQLWPHDSRLPLDRSSISMVLITIV